MLSPGIREWTSPDRHHRSINTFDSQPFVRSFQGQGRESSPGSVGVVAAWCIAGIIDACVTLDLAALFAEAMDAAAGMGNVIDATERIGPATAKIKESYLAQKCRKWRKM